MGFRTLVLAAAAFVAAVAAQAKPLKVLMIGNSFSVCNMKEMPKIAKSMGLELDLCSINIGGCSLERHWKNVLAPETAPYSPDWNCRGEVRPAGAPLTAALKDTEFTDYRTKKKYRAKGTNVPAMLAAEKWDVVTVQQASHFSWRPETYSPWGDDLVKKIRELAPQAKVYVQETWSYTPWDGRLAQWKMDQNEMYAKLNAAYAEFAKRHSLEVIPTGTAVQFWRRDLPVRYTENSIGGDVCGYDKFRQDASGKWFLDGDKFHFNPDGQYLQGLVWTAKLFGADVRKCAYAPKRLAGAKAELMKKVAMEAVAAQAK